MRIAQALLFVYFVWASYLQLNDPDPVRWIAIYGAAAAVCALAAIRGRVRALVPIAAALALVSLVWGAALAPALGRTTRADFFGHIGMVDESAEEARESLGLCIVSGWMLATLLWARRR